MGGITTRVIIVLGDPYTYELLGLEFVENRISCLNPYITFIMTFVE